MQILWSGCSYQDGLSRTTQTLDHVVVVHILIWDKRKSQINEYSDLISWNLFHKFSDERFLVIELHGSCGSLQKCVYGGETLKSVDEIWRHGLTRSACLLLVLRHQIALFSCHLCRWLSFSIVNSLSRVLFWCSPDLQDLDLCLKSFMQLMMCTRYKLQSQFSSRKGSKDEEPKQVLCEWPWLCIM
jgi:hypothetical protein